MTVVVALKRVFATHAPIHVFSDIKQEVADVAVVHDVFFAFDALAVEAKIDRDENPPGLALNNDGSNIDIDVFGLAKVGEESVTP